ncbi:MAG TPA: hypothetical protein VJP80_05415 [Candidatus Saccharimonadales bacterium]|nr:hypothetical protein [Candidatus Saccharimonadales bacterium]
MEFRPYGSLVASAAANTALILGVGHGHVPEADLGVYHDVNQADQVTSVTDWRGAEPVRPADWRIAEDSTFTADGTVRTDFPEENYNDQTPLQNAIEQATYLASQNPGDLQIAVAAHAPAAAGESEAQRDQALADQIRAQVAAQVPAGTPITATGVDKLTHPTGAIRTSGDDNGIRLTLTLNEGQIIYKACERDVSVDHYRNEDDTQVSLPYLVPLPVFTRRRKQDSDAAEVEQLEPHVSATEAEALTGEVINPASRMSARARDILNGYFELGATPRQAASRLRLPRSVRPARPGREWNPSMPRYLPAVLLAAAVATIGIGGAIEYKDTQMDSGICKQAGSWAAHFCFGKSPKASAGNNEHSGAYYAPPNEICPDATKYTTHITERDYSNDQPAGTKTYDITQKPQR